MRFGRGIALGALAFFWTVLVFTAAVFLTRNTDGENTGKIVGTIFSAVAFLPPVLLFTNWYRAQAGRDRVTRQQLHQARRHSREQGPEQPDLAPTSASRSDLTGERSKPPEQHP
jgi:hypothetical protein